eukprot:GHVS01090546.1.p1 GENE.GHVS01090546.1~~GHVS01090546.1.p1  ORF type:complete len:589 (+),score=135.07 GHVS01090546.1:419-2185(+)
MVSDDKDVGGGADEDRPTTTATTANSSSSSRRSERRGDGGGGGGVNRDDADRYARRRTSRSPSRTCRRDSSRERRPARRHSRERGSGGGGGDRRRSRHRNSRSRSREDRGGGGDDTHEDDAAAKEHKRRTGWDTSPDPTSLFTAATSATGSISGPLQAAFGVGGTGVNLSALMQKKAMCRIYVGSLDYYLTEDEIKQVFQAFGTITAVDMPKEGNRSKGFCFLEFSTAESADMAIKTMQGFQLKGRTIKVGRPTAVGAATMNPMPNLSPMGMAGLAGMSSAAGFAGLAAAGGAMGAAGGAAGATQAGAMAAAALLGGGGAAGQAGTTPKMPGMMMDMSNGAGSGANRIYVGNVPFSLSTEDLKQIFQVFGEILTCQLMPSVDVPGTHRGYGFIEFRTAEQSKLAIETMNGFEVAGKQLKVNYATALRNVSPGAAPAASPGGMSAMMYQEMAAAGTGANCIPVNYATVSPVAPVAPVAPADQQLLLHHELFPPPTDDEALDSCMIMLCNMVTMEEVDEELKDEVQEECSKYGAVTNVYIQLEGSTVKIFVSFATPQDAQSAVSKLNKRWFGGRQIDCRQVLPSMAAGAG